MKVAVFASGRGSNFEALLLNKERGKLEGIEIVALLSDNPRARAIEVAERYEVPVYVVDSSKRTGSLSRAEEVQFLHYLQKIMPDLIVFAGFMRIVSDWFIDNVPSKIINIHPSLLPAFKGLRAQKQALDAGTWFTGCTVHFVTSDVDSGEIIIQKMVEIKPGDTEETLSERILKYEHIILTEAVELFQKFYWSEAEK